MSVSEKQKKFAREWDIENMRTLSCRVRTEEADAFKAYCSYMNTTPGKVIKDYVMKCIRDSNNYNDKVDIQ